jgi:hypothetical protein
VFPQTRTDAIPFFRFQNIRTRRIFFRRWRRRRRRRRDREREGQQV